MNIFKKIGEFLFGKKDALSAPCQKTYEQLEKDHSERVIKACKEIKEEKLKEIDNPYVVKVNPSTSPVTYTNNTKWDATVERISTAEIIVVKPQETKEIPSGLVKITEKSVAKEISNLMGTSINYETGEPLVRERPIATSGYLRTENDVAPEPGILTTSGTDDIMVVDITPPKITFFTPEDNKEIKLDEKKSDEIKKKRQYKKKKKK